MSKKPQKILSVIGQVKTFITLGEQYEVLLPLHALKNGDLSIKNKDIT